MLLPPIPWQPERAHYQPGAAPNPFAVTDRLAEHGIDTVLLDPDSPFPGFTASHPLLQAASPCRALRVLTGERAADIAIAIFEGPALPLVMLRRLFRWRVPVVLWDIGITEAWPLRERMLDAVVPRVAGIFVLSANQMPYIANRWGRHRGVELLGHAVDTVFYAPNTQAAAAPGPILSIGDDAGRDFACLLDIASKIDADIIFKTRSLAPDTPLPPRVAVQRARLSYPDLRDLYAAARIVVVPLHETFNASGVSSILEASAMGRPLVVTETAAMRDFIIPGETCLSVPPGDRDALLAAINRLLAEPDTCARLGANARKFVQQHCAQAVFADRFAGLLRRYARPARL